MSGPQWLHDFVLRDRWVVAVAGTHGKTTTAGMATWILEACGYKPGFVIGGVPVEKLEKEIEASATNFTKLNELMKEKEEKERRKREAGPSWIQRKIDSLTKEIFSDDDMK